ncbi:MAG: hypothetical protein PHS54_05590 [Clostridia bacterium]|nr:hypothetical protein [Clostridia bacterium]
MYNNNATILKKKVMKMTKKKSYSKIIICLILVFALFFPMGTGFIFADETTLNLDTLISDFSDGSDSDQEITDDLGFSFYDENGWTPSSYTDTESAELILNDVFPYSSTDGQGQNANLISLIDFDALEPEESFYYGTTEKAYDDLSSTSIGNNAILFVTSDNKVLGIESQNITIPANSVYVLTFKVGIRARANNVGLNAKIMYTNRDGNQETGNMSAIKTISTSSYTTYAFLIQGNEFTEKTFKLQLLWGNISGSEAPYTASNEKGYAAISSFQLFSVDYNQFEDLSSSTTNRKQVDLFSTNPSYDFIPNGYFSYAANQLWDNTISNQINDFLPTNWTQTTATTDIANRVANYGIIDVNSTKFAERMTALGLDLVNPGNPNTSTNNNVLLLQNETTTYQTITSAEATLTKNKYYEISFKFNTPATKTSEEAEDNSLNFYIVNSAGGTIYTRENMFSYTEWADDSNEWATFRVFIKAPSTDKKVKFVIKLGTEENTKAGYAYIDDIQLISKASETNIFDNTIEDTFILKTEDSAPTTYLATGILSFTNLLELDTTLDENDDVNRSLAVYDYTTETTTPVDEEDDEEEDDETTTDPTALSYLWYVIPSILLALCTILGLIIFYTRKIKSKIKLPAKRKKNSYDRKTTLEKQISDREKAELKNKANLDNQLNKINSQIEKLEATYEKAKSNPTKLGEYVKKRENLQNQQTKLIEMINNKN